MLPAIIAGGALADVIGGLVVAEVASKTVDIFEGIGTLYDQHFMHNFRTKELTLMISRNMTTDTKNLSGSIMPENLNDKKIEQIERLIQVTLNQGKFR